MGNELTIDDDSLSAEQKSMGEQFDSVFPFYLSIGMTYEQFWCQDVTLVVAYRKAYELKQQRENERLWLQGMYIYEGVQSIIYNGWCRNENDPPRWYPDKPYPLTEKEIREREEAKRKEEEQKSLEWFKNLPNIYNK